MKTLIAGLAVLAVTTLGLAPKAHASPLQPAATSVLAHSRWSGGVGVSVRGGHHYAEPAGFYRTQYRWVPVTQFLGYDAYGRPVYTTSYVQQAYTVWVPTARYYAPRPTWGAWPARVSGRSWHCPRHAPISSR